MENKFTTVVTVDEHHLKELMITWFYWERFKPEIFKNPLVFLIDSNMPEADKKVVAEFADYHGNATIHEVAESNPFGPDRQRDRMLYAILTQAPGLVKTPVWLKLDTDAIAIGPGKWIQDEWLDPDFNDSIIAHPWGYTKPADALIGLRNWLQHFSSRLIPKISNLDSSYVDSRNRVYKDRIIGWCSFINTAFSKIVAGMAVDKIPPLISHDTTLWFVANTTGLAWKPVNMKRFGWEHRNPLAGLKSPQKISVAPPYRESVSKLIERLIPDANRNCGIFMSEVGVWKGETSEYLLDRFPNLKLTMVDSWHEDPLDSENRKTGGSIPNQTQEAHDKCREKAIRRTERFHDRRTIYIMDSCSASLRERRWFDIIFLDSNHTHIAVNRELSAWVPKISNGGIICGHDYGHPRFPGVKKAVDEFVSGRKLKLELHPGTVWSVQL